jgi:hypothetical protein
MKITFIFILALSGCATRIDNGAFHFVTYADAAEFNLTAPGVTLTARGLSHSRPTSAALRGTAHAVATIGTAAIPFAGGANTAVKAASVIPAIVPAFRTGASSQ